MRIVQLPLLAAVLAATSCQAPEPPGVVLPANAAVTVYPVLLAGHPDSQVATVVGMLLERGGLQQVDVAAAAFTPPAGGFDQQAEAFAAFVRNAPPPAGYALFASFEGAPQRGVDAVQGALVDGTGAVVWRERQAPGAAAFDRAKPDCPMDCAVLLAQRLRAPLQLQDPTRSGAPEGKLAARLKPAAAPDDAERAAMQQRLQALLQLGSAAEVRVLPVRIGDRFDAAAAAELATRINERGLLHATAVTTPVRIDVPASSNEQQVVWSAARALQAEMRTAPAGSGYVLFADYLLPPQGAASAVHFYLLTADGELVAVDYQNDHHDDFQRIGPDSPAKCAELVVARLAGRLR